MDSAIFSLIQPGEAIARREVRKARKVRKVRIELAGSK